MLALAGAPLGLDFLFLDPAERPCAASLGEHLQAPYDDDVALDDFCARSDVATLEFENVPASAAQKVAAQIGLRPGPAALAVAQDRLEEKRLFDRLKIAVPRYMPVATRQALEMAVRNVGLPAVLKTRRMGYDGKGQAVLRTPADVDRAWTQLGGQPLILEAFVPFDREVSCIGVRSVDGDLRCYPIAENRHFEGILRLSVPNLDDPLQQQAESALRKVAEALDYVGVLAFEFFVCGNELFANEIAPRVHNSGHWSIEGSHCSQFENHLRAVAGLPLGDTSLRGPCAMLNLIGTMPPLARLAALPGAHPHVYGKAPKPLRKIGHLTLLADDPVELQARIRQAEALISSHDD